MALIPGVLLLFLLQGSQPAGPVKLERVTEVVQFLAADERLGRDTPSAGLDEAAEYLAKGFAAAGLKPGAADGTFFHTYTRPGTRLVSAKATLTVRGEGKEATLAPQADFRLWSARSAASMKDAEVLVVDVGEAAGKGLDRRMGGTKPTLLVVAEDSPLWRCVERPREMLGGGRGGPGGPPTLLVRKGALPAGELRVDLEVPAPEAVELKLRNVVALLPGTTRKAEHLVFTAHYDHIGVGLPVAGDAIHNGADDDATGTTAVLTLAEAFARAATKAPLPRSLLFVCFSGEEKGLLGSRAFAETPPVPLTQMVANFNLEMLGRPQPGKPRCAWITGSQYSDFQDLVRPGFERAGIQIIDFDMATGLFGASDNYSLAQKGVVAHSISAGSLHADYHKPSDHVDKLELPHMTAVINGIYEAGSDLARAESRPAWNEQGMAATASRPGRRR